MTRETAQKHRKEINAFADGAEIEYQDSTGKWWNAPSPAWDPNTVYRIKPREPREWDAGVDHNGKLCDPALANEMNYIPRIRVREILDEPETGKGEA